MYKILTATLEDDTIEYIVYNVIKKKEIARYATYEEAYLDIVGR
jgi:hypothetical protein